jgi:ribosome-binding factor A
MSHRRARVGKEMRQELASILSQRVSDPRLAGLMVMEVRPSPDLSFARVFYRTLGDREEVSAALEKAKPYIRRCLAETSRRRVVPQLEFRFDESVDRAARVEDILDELAEARRPEGGAGEDGIPDGDPGDAPEQENAT